MARHENRPGWFRWLKANVGAAGLVVIAMGQVSLALAMSRDAGAPYEAVAGFFVGVDLIVLVWIWRRLRRVPPA